MSLLPTELSSLQSLKVLQSIGNPEVPISRTDMAGLIAGGLLGWYFSSKISSVPKYIGVIAGAELGILLARFIVIKSRGGV